MDDYIIKNREDYTNHIHDMDQISEMRRILDKIEIVRRDHTVESTDFLNPYTVRLAKSILNRFTGISFLETGGYDEAERQVILIQPDYHYLLEEDLTIAAIRLEGNMDGLSHPDFLGAILNLGITRDKVGDIMVHSNFADIVVKKEIESFILLNLKKIANNNFKASKIYFSDLRRVEENYREKNETLSSLRLDAYISATYNLSRKDGQKLIESGKVRVNWEPIERISYEIDTGDIVSTRGYGRSKLHSIVGKSRKDRFIVKIRLLI